MMKKIFLIIPAIIIIIATNSEAQQTDVYDTDSNVYKTVTIGKQVWMKSNLRTTRYNDGTEIPYISGNDAWANTTTGAYCKYNNSPGLEKTYGKLYNWYAVNDSSKICPTGWHVPSNAEWKTMITFLGGDNLAGEKLKETGIANWEIPNNRATNSSNFTALPGGCRKANGAFSNIKFNGIWWSASVYNSTDAGCWILNYHFSNINNNNTSKKNAYSVRCIKD